MPHKAEELPVGDFEVEVLEHQLFPGNLVGGDTVMLHPLDEVLIVGKA